MTKTLFMEPNDVNNSRFKPGVNNLGDSDKKRVFGLD